MRSTIALLATMVVATATHAADATKPAAKITYDDHILPFLKDKCVGCHNQDKKRGGLILSNYTRLMEGGSSGACVKPGDADNSLLFKVVAHTSEPFMPPRSPKSAQANIDLIQKWINSGAPENVGSKVVVADKPKVDFTLPSVVKGKPSGPPPMPPKTLPLEPIVRAPRDTAISALASSPWAPLLAVAGQKQVLLYHSDTLELLGVLPFPEGAINVLKFSRNGSLLIAGGGRAGKSGKVVVWSVTKGERLLAVGEENDAVLAADISPDQTQIALGGPGKVVRLYSTKDGKLQHEIRKHTDWVTALEYSPDGVLLASGDRNGGLFVWEAFSAREYFTLKGHSSSISEISWRGDSNVVASGSEDGSIRLYEMENGNQIRGWNAHGGVRAVRYSRDGKLISAGRDKVARLWDGNGGAQRAYEAFPDIALRATFSHDGARVIAGDWTGQIVVWSTADGKRVGTLSANPPTVAEQLRLAEKTLADKQKLADTLAAAAKSSQVAFGKATADLALAQKAVGETASAVKAMEQKLAQARTAAANAQAALRPAGQEVKAKETLSQALAEASSKVKAESDKARDNTALAAALKRAQTLADQASAELTLARKALADVAAASRTMDTALTQAQQAHTAATTAVQSAPKNVAALQAAVKALQPKSAADKAAADLAAAELAQAKAVVAKWQAAAALVKKGG